VTDEGLVSAGQSGSERIQIRAWQPVAKPFGVDGVSVRDSTMGLKLWNTVATRQKGEKTGIVSGDNSTVVIEMEYRSSDFTLLGSSGAMESGILRVIFDRENLMDMMYTGDLSESSLFNVSNVSNDKRALREAKSIYFNELDMEVTLRLFSINDVLQISIPDVGYATLKLAELPLSLERQLVSYV